VLSDVIDLLRCPSCEGGLTLGDGVLSCPSRHAFDVARQGYVTLLRGGQPRVPGDGAAMVAARERFLGAGHYAPLVEELVSEAQRAEGTSAAAAHSGEAETPVSGPAASTCIVDFGAGTGHYLAQVLDAAPDAIGLALDTSPYALRRAARAHPRAAAVGCDIWRGLPLRDGTAALALNVFAPRDGAEIQRVLAPGGRLVVVTPTPRHLAELTDRLGLLRVDEHKQQRLDAKLGPYLTLTEQRSREWGLQLSAQDVEDVVAMGPNAWHEHAQPSGPLSATASITVSVYQR
jgi:23S rRNA (guanine745-N1)-methyltransferase